MSFIVPFILIVLFIVHIFRYNKDRKKKTDENTMKKIISKKSTSGRIQVSLLCIMCIAILIVSFMALVKMENNTHGMMVFAWGSLMNLIIFSSGMSHIRNTIRCV